MPASVSLHRTSNIYYTLPPQTLGTCFVLTTVTKVVCLLGQCTVKYKGKGLLCGNIVGRAFGCLDTRLQNTKPSSLCQFPVSLPKMPKSTKEISKRSRHGCCFPPRVSPDVLEAAGRAASATVGSGELRRPKVSVLLLLCLLCEASVRVAGRRVKTRLKGEDACEMYWSWGFTASQPAFALLCSLF